MNGLRSIVGAVGLALVLGGCMQGSSPPLQPATEASPQTVSGVVQNWPGGTATLRPVTTDETGTIVLRRIETSAPISADGAFQLELPPVLSSDLLSVLPLCMGSFEGTVTPEQWAEFFAEMGVFQGEQYTGALILANSPDVYFSAGAGDRLIFRLYLDRDVTVNGTCFEMGFTQEYAADARAGWNYLLFEITEVALDGAPTAIRLSIPQAIPDGLNWYYVDVQGAAVRLARP